MSRIDDLLAGDDEEVDEEYVAAQRAKRNANAKRPKGTVQGQPPRQLQSKPETAIATAKGLKTTATQDSTIAVAPAPKRLCKAQSAVRYPKDYEMEELRGQPILNADGARQWKPCERPPMHGQEVCQKHGGMAPQAQQAAKLRLLAATEPLIAALLRIGLNETLSAADRTRAINSALDRAGFRGGVDVNVEAPAWQKLLGDMFGPSTQYDVLEAEVVEREPVDIMALNARVAERVTPDEPDSDDPRARADWVNASEELPHAWKPALRPRQKRGRR